MTTTFILKEPTSKEETLIFLVIRIQNKRFKISTNEKIIPSFWNKKDNRVKETAKFPEYPEFNTRLDKIKSIVKNSFRQFQNDNDDRPPTIDELKTILKKIFNKKTLSSKKKDFFGFVEKFIQDSKNRVNDKTGKIFANSTIGAYKNTFSLLQSFKSRKKIALDFDAINLDFYQDFTEYLTKEKGFANNTIGKHIKTIKTFLNDATERGINSNIAYKSKRFKVITEKTDSIYLNEKELNELYSLDFSKSTRLEKVRDLFIVGCWTGLRFSDFSSISSENIKDGFLETETQKTGEKVVIPIHSTVKEIMKKYKGKSPNSLPPAISNSKMNDYLKEIGQMAKGLHIKTTTSITKGGINITKNQKKFELITTHTARRSFASNLYLSGFPAISIMKITGHRSEKAFLRYIKITPSENAKLLQLHWEKNHKLKAV